MVTVITRTLLVPASPDAAHALLADPRRMPEIHPLIHRITVDREAEQDGEHQLEFAVDEHVPLLGFKVPNRYRGEIRWRDASSVRVRGTAQPGIEIVQDWQFTAVEAGTRIDQKTTVSEPWWMFGFTGRTARGAHDHLLVQVGEVLGARP